LLLRREFQQKMKPLKEKNIINPDIGNLIADELFERIASIPDPEIPVITISELGILRSVDLIGDTCVVTITPTYTGCPAMGLLEEQIREVLRDYDITNIKVALTYTPAWSTDWMSDSTKAKLKDYGIAPPMHSSCASMFAGKESISCPKCNASQTKIISRFGSTACKALYSCLSCKEPFEYFKCH
jgi:ring-1,2-phenylacetyl-CoA epoxidase subunit PaaD